MLIHEYAGRIPIYHFDAYRLEDPAAFEDLGIADYWVARPRPGRMGGSRPQLMPAGLLVDPSRADRADEPLARFEPPPSDIGLGRAARRTAGMSRRRTARALTLRDRRPRVARNRASRIAGLSAGMPVLIPLETLCLSHIGPAVHAPSSTTNGKRSVLSSRASKASRRPGSTRRSSRAWSSSSWSTAAWPRAGESPPSWACRFARFPSSSASSRTSSSSPTPTRRRPMIMFTH